MDTDRQLNRYLDRIERVLDARLPPVERGPSRLHEAVRYAVLNGGKRLRPLLTYATGEMLGVAPGQLDSPAAAVEMIHCYSLVHDDLPAMDNDDLRRGRPTTHRRYDEATAILVGDALQMLAFEILVDNPAVSDSRVQAGMVRILATAGGAAGMTGGQALDLAAENSPTDIEMLERIHTLKTGRLIRAAVLLGAAPAPRLDTATEQTLRHFGDVLGLAFQVRDDLLDIESDTVTLGKPQGSDMARGKATFPALLGIEGSRRRLADLESEAQDLLAGFGKAAVLLQALTEKAIRRDR